MVLELGFETEVDETNFHHEFLALLPKLISYAISFLMLGIMWLNHHSLFRQLETINSKILWSNLFLLFWMSLVPFVTGLIGSNPLLWQATLLYGLTFAACVLGFMLIRIQILNSRLSQDKTAQSKHSKVNRKNVIAISLYLIGAMVGYFSISLAFILFLIVPFMYLIPDKILKNT